MYYFLRKVPVQLNSRIREVTYLNESINISHSRDIIRDERLQFVVQVNGLWSVSAVDTVQ